MRLPWPALAAGTVVVALGAAGLIRGAVPQSVAGAVPPPPSNAGPVAVTNAYVVPPVPPNDTAAAYFTVYNTTSTPDTLQTVETGAGAEAVLHVYQDGLMVVEATGAPIPAHGSLTLSVGKSHVMISKLFGKLLPGQTVNLELDFRNAGAVNVIAPVIAVGAAPPSGAARSAPAQTPTSRPSGAHS